MALDSEQIVMATTMTSTGGQWASGRLNHGGTSINLADENTPLPQVGTLLDTGLTVAFSGRSAGTIPWGTQAWDQLTQAVAELGPSPGQLLLRGHSHHVLADAPACLGWLDHCHEAQLEVGIGLSPASMLVPSMLAAVEDHLTRMFQYLGGRVGAVIIEDAAVGDSGEVCGRPAGEGLLPGQLLGELIDAYVPQEVVVCVFGRDWAAGRQWLWPNAS